MPPLTRIQQGLGAGAPGAVLFAATALMTPAAWAQASVADLFEAGRVDFLGEDHRLELPADLDGDGHPELVGWWATWSTGTSARYSVLRQDPASGAWTDTVRSFNSGSGSYVGATDTVAGDFDGDGRDEVLALHARGIDVIELDAAGDLQRVLAIAPLPGLTGAIREAAVLDADGDGLDDVVVVGSDHALLLRSSLAPGLTLTEVDRLPSYGGETRLACIDVSGTATEELVLLQDHAHPALWTIGVDGAAFGAASRVFLRPTANGERIDIAPGDIDGDGDVDLVAFGHDGRYQVLRNEGGELVVETDRVGGPATALADLDGDGDLDGICCGGSGQSQSNTMPSVFHLALNLGAETFEPAVAFGGLGAHHVAGALDYDLDGDVDVLAGRAVLLNRTEIGRGFCDATFNSSGGAARLHVTGRASVGAGGPSLSADGLPSSTTCVLLVSPAADPVTPWAFWDGELCLGTNGLRRLRVAPATAAGSVDLGGIASWSTGGFNIGGEPGEAFTYQVWFRDSLAGGTGANVSDAARILLTH